MKVCSSCNLQKEYSFFHKRKSGSADGYFAKCKQCRKEEAALRYERDKDKISKAAKRWAKNNPEARKRASKKWRENNKDKCREYTQAYRQRNPEKVAESIKKRCKKKSLEASLRWQKNHPEKAAHLSALRRAKIKKAVPAWANVFAIAKMYKNRPEGYHVDHIVPLSGELVCGLHCEDNLQYLPALENIAKNNRLIEEYCYG